MARAGGKWLVAAALLGFGLFHLTRHRHPRWGGMRVGARDLAIWSFLMASAHGAGLMALPFILDATAMDPTARAPMPRTGAGVAMGVSDTTHTSAAPAPVLLHDASGPEHVGHSAALMAGLPDEQAISLVAIFVHALGYFLITGVVAVAVYERLGLRLLRSAWVNLDLIWAGALLATAVLTLLM